MNLVGRSFARDTFASSRLEAIVRDLSPMLDETLAGITADG